MSEHFIIHSFTRISEWPFEDTTEAMQQVNTILPPSFEVARMEKGDPGYYLLEFKDE